MSLKDLLTYLLTYLQNDFLSGFSISG